MTNTSSTSLLTALLLLGFSVPSIDVRGAQTQPGETRVSTSLVLLRVTVASKDSKPIIGLKRSDFEVFDGKASRQIVSFSSEDEPVSAVILLDLSRSVSRYGEAWMSAIRESIESFLKHGNPSNEYQLEIVSSKPFIAEGWTKDRKAIIGAVDRTNAANLRGYTALYDGCRLAIEELQSRANVRKAIVMFSDGEDNSSENSLNQLKEVLKRFDVAIYSVSRVGADNPLAGFGANVLTELSRVNGGDARHVTTRRELQEAFQSIAFELRHQYLIGFDSLDTDGKWHSVRVKLVAPNRDASGKKTDLAVRTRLGYYASLKR